MTPQAPRPNRPRRSRLTGEARVLLVFGAAAAWAVFAWIALTVEVTDPYHTVRNGSLREVGPWLAMLVLLVLGGVLLTLGLSGLRRPKRRTTPVGSMDVAGPLAAHPRAVPLAQNWRTGDQQPR